MQAQSGKQNRGGKGLEAVEMCSRDVECFPSTPVFAFPHPRQIISTQLMSISVDYAHWWLATHRATSPLSPCPLPGLMSLALGGHTTFMEARGSIPRVPHHIGAHRIID